MIKNINTIKGCTAAIIQLAPGGVGKFTRKIASNGSSTSYKAQLGASAALFALINAFKAIENSFVSAACYLVTRSDLGEAKAKVALHQMLLVLDYAALIFTSQKKTKLKEIASKLVCIGTYNTAFNTNIKEAKAKLDLKIAAKAFNETDDIKTVKRLSGKGTKFIKSLTTKFVAEAGGEAANLGCKHLEPLNI